MIDAKVKGESLKFMEFKKTGTYVLKGVDELQQILDDQLNLLMMIKASPYIKNLIKTANNLENKIVLI